MSLDLIIELARKADACPYNIKAVVAYGEAVAMLRPDVLLGLVDTPVAALDAAQKYASAFEDDDRQDIEVDVINAFLSGAKWAQTCSTIANLQEQPKTAGGPPP